MLRLIRYCICVLILVAFSYRGYGQYRLRVPVVRQPPLRERALVQEPGRRLELIKENYISQRLHLSFQQARQFWPVYRRYVQDQTAIRLAKQEVLRGGGANDPNAASKVLDYEAQLVNVRKQYLEEFMKILPQEKVNELYKAEREFTDEVLRQLSERKGIRAGD